MNSNKRTELQVSALENGTVIDHITYGFVLQVMLGSARKSKQ